MSTLTTTYIPFEQFLIDPAIDKHTEWVDGTPQPLHSVVDQHDRLNGWLCSLLYVMISELDLGRVLGRPFMMYLPEIRRARSPDLIFVNTEHLHRIQSNHLRGPADLAIEIISPQSRHRDTVTKRQEYQDGGVPEYWIIAPDGYQASFYQLQGGSTYQEVPPDDQGIYQTPLLPQAWFDVNWLRKPSPPKLFDIWRDWGFLDQK